MSSTRRFVADEPLALGVASRLAGRLGASPAVVRVAFLLLGLAAGVGVAGYLFAAAALAGREEPPARPVLLRHNLAVVIGTAGALLLVESFLHAVPTTLLWPAGLVAFAATLAHPTLDGERSEWRAMVARVAAGVILMIAGFLTAVASAPDLASLWQAIAAALILLVGIGFLLAPFLQDLIDSADRERRDRIRAEERSDIAAHLHDSVLQTLTLIQNRASDPQITAALAHHQERELRKWLYAESDESLPAQSLRPALERAAEEVEDQYLTIVECIVVGDSELNDAAGAVVGAAREAMINAAKFAEAPMISVYAEVSTTQLVVFVRDRGVGFDVERVPTDRRGLSDSIQHRVERFGGAATIRSAPGAGTEVRIEMPPA